MTQPIDIEQRRVDEQLADAPSEALLDGLFDPMGHDPISDKEVEAYVAFLKGLPQSCTEIPLTKDRMMMCFETYRGIGIWAILPALAQICTNLATRFRFCGNLKKQIKLAEVSGSLTRP